MIPVEKNKKYIVNISAISSDGNGIAKIDGFTIFVPLSVLGDKLEVLIVKLNSSHAYAKITEIIEPSENRINPLCENYLKCGGCTMLQSKYTLQLESKKGFVENAFSRIGGFKEFKISEIIGMDNPYKYRNKMVFPFSEDKEGNIQFGFFRQRSHDLIPLNSCLLGDDINIEILKTVKKHMEINNIKPYDEKNHSGLVRRVFTRKSHHKNEIMIVISVNGTYIPHSEELVKNLLCISKDIVSIFLNINTEKNNLVLGDRNKLLFGKQVISDTLCGLNYEISPNSFFQVNPIQTEKLYKLAIEYADIQKGNIVMDIYCGIGTISLYAAKYAKKVIGIEIVEAAIKNAKENAVRNNVFNAEFYASSAEKIVPKLIKNGVSPNIVILDPPRKGSDEKTLAAIASATPQKIVYISCNPATLARDAKFLSTMGYYPEIAAAVDMFPHTAHVETVVLLQRQNT